MIIKSKNSGLTVTIPDEEYGGWLAQYGEHGAYSAILNQAGRVHKHRIALEEMRAQELTEEERQQVESVARTLSVQAIIDQYIVDMGYGNYLTRRDRGGMMPEGFARIVSSARESCALEIEHAQPTDSDLNHAMLMLGFYTDDDRRWSERVSGWCKWEITAPEGWGGGTMLEKTEKKEEGR